MTPLRHSAVRRERSSFCRPMWRWPSVRATLATCAATLTIAIPSGCASDPTVGYALEPPFRQDIRTVNLALFDNRTFVRDVQFELADALVKEIEATTPWKVTGGHVADTAIIGTITNVQLQQLSKSSRTGLTEEGVVSVTVDFEWRDLRTGTPIVERRGFTTSGLFLPSAPAGEPIEIGQYAAIQAMARDIVAELRSPW